MGTHSYYSTLQQRQIDLDREINDFILVRLRRNAEYIRNVSRKRLGGNFQKQLPESLSWILYLDRIVTIDFNDQIITLSCDVTPRKWNISKKAQQEEPRTVKLFTIPTEIIFNSCWTTCKYARFEILSSKREKLQATLREAHQKQAELQTSIREAQLEVISSKSELESNQYKMDQLEERIKSMK